MIRALPEIYRSPTSPCTYLLLVFRVRSRHVPWVSAAGGYEQHIEDFRGNKGFGHRWNLSTSSGRHLPKCSVFLVHLARRRKDGRKKSSNYTEDTSGRHACRAHHVVHVACNARARLARPGYSTIHFSDSVSFRRAEGTSMSTPPVAATHERNAAQNMKIAVTLSVRWWMTCSIISKIAMGYSSGNFRIFLSK